MAVKRSTGNAAAPTKSSFFGCQLREDEKEYHCKLDTECKEHVVLRMICLDADAREELHTVEIEAQNNKTMMVNLASLQPNVVNTINLGGYELRPPFTFRLTSGSGPVYISGQHFIDNHSEVEQENNSSPVKRCSKHAAFWKSHRPNTKKLKLVDDYDMVATDDDSGSDVYELPGLPRETIDLTVTDNDESSEYLSDSTSSSSSEDDDDEDDDDDDDSAVEIIEQVSSQPQETSCNDPLASPPCKPPLSVGQIKSRIKALAVQGHMLPKTRTDFSDFVLKSYSLENEEALKQLWNYTEYIVNSLHK